MFTKLNEKREGFTLIELLIVVAIIGILAAIAIPQYARYRKNAQNSAAESAYHAVALAEEAYYTKHNAYTTTYTDLVNDAGLSRDPNVRYGDISTTFSRNSDGFYFQVRHVAGGTTLYQYQSNTDPIVKTFENDNSFTGITTF